MHSPLWEQPATLEVAQREQRAQEQPTQQTANDHPSHLAFVQAIWVLLRTWQVGRVAGCVIEVVKAEAWTRWCCGGGIKGGAAHG